MSLIKFYSLSFVFVMVFCVSTSSFAFETDAFYKIIAKHSNKCAEIKNMSKETRANIQQGTCNGMDYQLFKLHPESNGTFSIWSKHSFKVLDADGGSCDDRTNIQQFYYHRGSNQKFSLEPTPVDPNYFLIKPTHCYNKCLDVKGISTEEGANIQIHDCHYGENQLWRLEKSENNFNPK